MPTGIYVRTEEQKKKIGESVSGNKNGNFGRHWTEEEKLHMGKGRIVSEQTREKIRLSRIGKTASEETIEKYRKRKQELANDPTYRKRLSDGVRKALLENPDTNKKRSESSKKRWQDPEFRSKMSAKHLAS